MHVARVMGETGMVPLFYHGDIEIAKKLLHAIYDGGARVLEFTNRGDYAHEVFAALNKYAAKAMPDLIMGVGSVTDGGAASLYLQLGANFVVTPVFREDIAIVCNRKKVLWSPGCGSLTEITRAEELGCEIVKLFPGGTYGPGFIKDIKGPQPWTNIMPTGGVSPTADNLAKWFQAGAYCVGMGSQLMVKDGNGAFDCDRIKDLTREALAIIKKLKA